VDSVVAVRLAILRERDFLIDPHSKNEFAMPGALAEVNATRPGDPVSFFGHLDDVPLAEAVLALRQRAEAAKRVRSEAVVMVHDVGKESGHLNYCLSWLHCLSLRFDSIQPNAFQSLRERRDRVSKYVNRWK